jgi:hypothetical protein
VEAIREHQSQASEANQVINNYENLSRQQKKNLILFLRSLWMSSANPNVPSAQKLALLAPLFHLS